MGGATSRLEETNWELADGRLGDANDTVDGRPPTPQYQTYELVKRGYNQREFDVVDTQRDLLYSTRTVLGTIACFDVLGNRLDEPVLRVNVDLSRRYWVVYRFGVPAFEGQRHDEEASEKLRAEHRDRGAAGEPPQLYRTALVTVSWSRYVSVTAHYGAPTPQMVLDYQDGLDRHSDDQVETDWATGIPTETESDESTDFPVDEKIHVDTMNIGVVQPCDEESTKQHNECKSEAPEKEMHELLPMPDLIDNKSQESEIPIVTAHSSRAPSLEQGQTAETFLQSSIARWVASQSQHLHETTKQILYTNQKPSHKHQDPLEGVISLDKPLLMCQEIYTRIVGNHQTSLVSKEQALELLCQDEVNVGKCGGLDDQSHPRGPGAPFSQSDPLREDDESRPPASDDYSQSLFEFSNEKKEDCADEAVADASGQPLVGYWLWENTLRTHKMKLHLAKGSDLALHIVLAVIVNQVRLERNAVALAL